MGRGGGGGGLKLAKSNNPVSEILDPVLLYINFPTGWAPKSQGQKGSKSRRELAKYECYFSTHNDGRSL